MNDNAKQTACEVIEILNHYDDMIREIDAIIDEVCDRNKEAPREWLVRIASSIVSRERDKSIQSRLEDYFCEEASRC